MEASCMETSCMKASCMKASCMKASCMEASCMEDQKARAAQPRAWVQSTAAQRITRGRVRDCRA
jgi:hypothetical protein